MLELVCVALLGAVGAAPPAAVGGVLGVAPANYSRYAVGAEGFRCFDGRGVGAVNDDYCDCADGSDEPGTAACSHARGARFWCANEGYLALLLPTAKVGDGVCDCCDGSDERGTAADDAAQGCPDTCRAMGARHRARASAAYRTALRGRQLRARLVLGAAQEAGGWQRKAAQAAAATAALKELLPRLEYFKQHEVQRETAERLVRARAPLLREAGRLAFVAAARDEEEEAAKQRPPAKPDRAPRGAGAELLLSSPVNLTSGGAVTLQRFIRGRLARREVGGRRKPKAKLSRLEERRQGIIRSYINAPSEELRDAALERLLQAVGLLLSPLRGAWELMALGGLALSRAAAWAHSWAVWAVPPARAAALGARLLRAVGLGANAGASVAQAEEGAEADGAEAPAGAPAEAESWAGRAQQLWRSVRRVWRGPKAWLLRQSPQASWAAQVVWDAFPSYYAWYFPALDPSVTRPEARALAQLLELGARELEAAAGRATDVAARLARDDGPDRAFLPLRGKCFHLSARGYTYKVCPFGRISQDGTTLGSWERWGDREGAGGAAADAFSAQWFPNGERCYNGPVRSAALRFACGAEDAVLEVDEPSPCVYDVRLSTPAACSDGFFNETRAQAQLWGVAAEVEQQWDSAGAGVCEAGDTACATSV